MISTTFRWQNVMAQYFYPNSSINFNKLVVKNEFNFIFLQMNEPFRKWHSISICCAFGLSCKCIHRQLQYVYVLSKFLYTIFCNSFIARLVCGALTDQCCDQSKPILVEQEGNREGRASCAGKEKLLHQFTAV